MTNRPGKKATKPTKRGELSRAALLVLLLASIMFTNAGVWEFIKVQSLVTQSLSFDTVREVSERVLVGMLVCGVGLTLLFWSAVSIASTFYKKKGTGSAE